MDEARTTGSNKHESEMLDHCRRVAEFSPMPMAAVTGSGHLLRYVNAAFCLLTGKTQEALVNTPFPDAVPTGQECLSLLSRVYRTGVAESHTGQHGPGDRFYWSYVMWPLLASDGSRAGIMIQVTETTPFIIQTTDVNQALILSSVRQHEMTEAADRMNEQLQRANEDLKQFAFAASHDLQEPLRMITNFSQLLIKRHRDLLNKEADDCVRFINDGSMRMQRLLADLLTYTETAMEKEEISEPVSLDQVVEKVTHNLKQSIDESGAAVSGGPLPTVDGQEVRFVQLFQNLIGNAIKYRGGAAPLIQVSAARQQDGWLISVSDNGVGIEREHYQTIFGVFKRLHGKAIPGTGIGLAISQRVVERYGGKIWVESEVGVGTTFYFTIPTKEAKHASYATSVAT